MMTKVTTALLILFSHTAVFAEDAWQQAESNGEQARQSLKFCWRLSQGWLQFADPETGLLPRRLGRDTYWNAKDCAADNYPFLTLTAFFTDRELFEGPMRKILDTEQRLCNRVDRLPDDWDFATQAFRTSEPNLDALIFGASEYVKDGLLPLTEWLGETAWSERMIELVDDVWKHAKVETEVGLLPSASHEVAGELMQALSRLHWMTGNEKYRDQAFLLADYSLVHHLPTKADDLRFDDHGCEVIGGLSEVYFLAAHKAPKKHAQWQSAMHAILDRSLEVGVDENGLFYDRINPVTGKILKDERTDNWGYNYNAFAVVAKLDKVKRYDEAIRHALVNLPKSKDYAWERGGADGLADSLEGGLNLLNRYPVPEAAEWADYTAQRLLAKQRDTGVVEGWYGDGNSARTLIMYALWKSQGAYVEAWRADLRLGAAVDEDGYTRFTISADWSWHGTLRFDIPRHKENLNLPEDYPRLNQFPEWFTVEKGTTYETDEGSIKGSTLRKGLPVSVTPAKPFRIRIKTKK